MFWDHVDPWQGECWLWTGYRNPKGYGMSGRHLAHRLAWEHAHGPVHAELCVLHRCDNRACVRPEHLFLGTRADNNHDMREKGRQQRGEGHYRARFTNAEAATIRERSRVTGMGYRKLAREYGVPTKTMQDLLRGRTYL